MNNQIHNWKSVIVRGSKEQERLIYKMAHKKLNDVQYINNILTKIEYHIDNAKLRFDKDYFKSMVSTEIFNAIEDKFGGVTV